MFGFVVAPAGSTSSSCSAASICARPVNVSRRGRSPNTLRMADEGPFTSKAVEEAKSEGSDTFSKIADKIQVKVDEFQEYISDIDGEEVLENTTDATKKLLDNFISGEWLQRGEVYGGGQLVLALMLLNGQPVLNGIVSLLLGPVTLLSGAVISGKAMLDLGVTNLSVWPAPVPAGTLNTTGMYEYVRHPIYSGVLLASLGFASATDSPARLALTVALAVLFAKKIEVEEEFLEEKYPDYVAYKQEVPFKLIPKIW